MGSKWEEFRLDEITQCIVDCPHSTPEWTTSGIIVLRNQNIRNGKLNLEASSYTNEDGYLSRIKRATPTKGDIVFTREAPMGEVCQVPENIQCCLGQRMVLIRPDEKKVLSDYLLYAFQSPCIKHQVGWNEGTGTTVSNVRIPNIKALTFRLPPLPEQKRISSILKTLDDKITLNQEMNRTLESMAQAIFKSWFVDFEPVKAKMRGEQPQGMSAEVAKLFPSTLVESKLGLIPEGWEVSTIGDEVKTVGGGTPSTKEAAYWDNGDIFWTSPKDLSGVTEKILSTTAKKITQAGLQKISSGLLPVDTVLLSSRAPIGYLALAKVPVAINQGYIAIKCQNVLPPEYILQWCAYYMENIKQIAGGTTFAEVSKSSFKSLKILVPHKEILEIFSCMLTTYYSKIHTNILDNTFLEGIRDTLLPKLMNGEIHV